jgi:hypothetical protein
MAEKFLEFEHIDLSRISDEDSSHAESLRASTYTCRLRSEQIICSSPHRIDEDINACYHNMFILKECRVRLVEVRITITTEHSSALSTVGFQRGN